MTLSRSERVSTLDLTLSRSEHVCLHSTILPPPNNSKKPLLNLDLCFGGSVVRGYINSLIVVSTHIKIVVGMPYVITNYALWHERANAPRFND